MSLDTLLSWRGRSPAEVSPSPNEFQVEEQVYDAFNLTAAQLRGVDPRLPPSDLEEFAEIDRTYPSLPIMFFESTKRKHYQMFYKNSTCAPIPSAYKVDFDNTYWQVLRTSAGVFYIYKAYYDSRRNDIIGASIRILAMVNRVSPEVTTYCQIWFESQNEPLIVRYYDYKHIWKPDLGPYTHGVLQPHLVTCKLPPEYSEKVPVAVSLVEQECSIAKNFLHVINEIPESKGTFAVCVRGRHLLKDTSPRLIEWMELLYVLGADKIFFYNFYTHPNISKVIDHYVALGKAEVTPISLPGGRPNFPLLQHYYLSHHPQQQYVNEIILYNDCLYRNLNSYKYIIPLDVDEVVVPVEHGNWTLLFDSITSNSKEGAAEKVYGSYNIPQSHFLDKLQDGQAFNYWDIPDFMYILKHVYRTSELTSSNDNDYSKTFYDTERVISLHERFPVHVHDYIQDTYFISNDSAKVHSYSEDCIEGLDDDCEVIRANPIEDNVVWNYKTILINRTMQALQDLGFFYSD